MKKAELFIIVSGFLGIFFLSFVISRDNLPRNIKWDPVPPPRPDLECWVRKYHINSIVCAPRIP